MVMQEKNNHSHRHSSVLLSFVQNRNSVGLILQEKALAQGAHEIKIKDLTQTQFRTSVHHNSHTKIDSLTARTFFR